MPNWTQHLARRDRHWHFELRITGLGLGLNDSVLADSSVAGDARYRWCIARPPWAAGSPASALWVPILASPLPTLLDEDCDPIGGFPKFLAGLQARLVDRRGQFSRLIKTESPPVAILQDFVDEFETTFRSPALGAYLGQVLWLDDEAIRVDTFNAFTGQAEVTRAFIGTTATEHVQYSELYAFTPKLLEREIELWTGPGNGVPSDMQRLATYKIDKAPLDEGTTTWTLTTTSHAAHGFSRRIPSVTRSLVITRVVFDTFFSGNATGPAIPPTLTALGPFVQLWAGGQAPAADEPLVFAKTSRGEIVGQRALNEIFRRDLLGTGEKAIEVGDSLTQVFFGHCWRHSPGPNPRVGPNAGGMTEASGWNRSTHVCDIALSLLTSPASPLQSPGRNYSATYGNWSVLPGGYGLGVPASRIDFASFLDLKTRRPDMVFDLFAWGADEAKRGWAVLDEMLRACGIRLHLDPLISVSLTRLPLAGESIPLISAANILADVNPETKEARPRIRDLALERGIVGQVRLLLGPMEREVLFDAGGAEETEIRVPWTSGYGLPFTDRITTRLHQLARDAYHVSVDVSPSVFFSLVPGGYCRLQLPRPPSLVSAAPAVEWMCEVLKRRLVPDDRDGVYGTVRLRLYPQHLRSSRVAPSARITLTGAAPTYTVGLTTFSEGQNDIDGFAVGDLLQLCTTDGLRVGALVQSVAELIAPNQIRLNGTFAGAAAAGDLLRFAPYDEVLAAQRDSFMFLAGGDDRSPSPTNPAALPYIWGDA